MKEQSALPKLKKFKGRRGEKKDIRSDIGNASVGRAKKQENKAWISFSRRGQGGTYTQGSHQGDMKKVYAKRKKVPNRRTKRTYLGQWVPHK